MVEWLWSSRKMKEGHNVKTLVCLVGMIILVGSAYFTADFIAKQNPPFDHFKTVETCNGDTFGTPSKVRVYVYKVEDGVGLRPDVEVMSVIHVVARSNSKFAVYKRFRHESAPDQNPVPTSRYFVKIGSSWLWKLIGTQEEFLRLMIKVVPK